MNRTTSLITAVVLSVATMLFAIPAVAQDQETPAAGQTVRVQDDTKLDLKPTEVEAALAAIETDSGIEDSVKDLLRTQYKQAIEALKESASNADKGRPVNRWINAIVLRNLQSNARRNR